MGSRERKGRETAKISKGFSRGDNQLSSTSPLPPKKPRPSYPPPPPKPDSTSYDSTTPQDTQYLSRHDYVSAYPENYPRQESGQSHYQSQFEFSSQPYRHDQQTSDMIASSSYNSTSSWATQSSNTSSGTVAQNQTPFAYDYPVSSVSGTYQQQGSDPYSGNSAPTWGYNQELPARTSSLYPSPPSKSQGRWQDTTKK